MSYIIQMPALPSNSHLATRLLVEFLVDSLWPSTLELKNKMAALLKLDSDRTVDIVGTKDVFSLCCSQIQKCVLHLLEIFQTEHRNHVVLQETRDCTLERLSCCLDKLHLVQKNVENISREYENATNECAAGTEHNDENISCHSILATPTYFVNWIDHSVELVTNLSSLVYKTDYKESSERLDTWTNEVIDSVSDLHTSIDELLLSAMTLCRYCLPSDQTIITVRCQVVLREAKKLISEIIEGDVDKAYQVTKDSLKLPLKPTYINVSIDMLKSALYILETSTNTALLALLVQCLSTPLSPLKNLEQHFKEGNKDTCSCDDVDSVEDCAVVKQFDFYNERLMQIGGFSISCSSDENRILSLKSGLASLEALDPQLVPAVMVAPTSLHARFLTAAWRQEVVQIRANIFLIVDPAAFSEKVKDIMNKKILELIKGNTYVNAEVCATINMGEVVLDFFRTYQSQEPQALVEHSRLEPLLADLQRALKECKTVSNLSSTEEDFLYEMPPTKQSAKKVTFEQLMKRLKLLFTIVNRINRLFGDDDESGRNVFSTDDSENTAPNLTHTIIKEKQTPVNGRHLVNNVSKNIFARDASVRQYSPSKCVISKMTKYLNSKKMQNSLSFSVQLDDLFSDLSAYNEKANEDVAGCTKNMNGSMNMSYIKSVSILYNFPVSQRDSMRKGVLMKTFNKTIENNVQTHHRPMEKSEVEYELDASDNVLDSTTQLQITDILDQLSNLSKMINLESQADCKKSVININGESSFVCDSPPTGNILRLSVNNYEQNVREVWNIPVNHSNVDDSRSEFSVTSSTQSNVTTFERLNDIDLLENKLNELKSSNV